MSPWNDLAGIIWHFDTLLPTQAHDQEFPVNTTLGHRNIALVEQFDT